MAEIVSLSQCAIGIGPCCLKMSARALGREEKKEKKNIFTKQPEWHSAFSLPQSLYKTSSTWVSTIRKKEKINKKRKKKAIKQQKIWLKSSVFVGFLFVLVCFLFLFFFYLCMCLLHVFAGLPSYCFLISYYFTPG